MFPPGPAMAALYFSYLGGFLTVRSPSDMENQLSLHWFRSAPLPPVPRTWWVFSPHLLHAGLECFISLIRNITLLVSHPAARGLRPHEVLLMCQTHSLSLTSHSPSRNPVCAHHGPLGDEQFLKEGARALPLTRVRCWQTPQRGLLNEYKSTAHFLMNTKLPRERVGMVCNWL